VALIPHLNTPHPGEWNLTAADVYLGDLALLQRCTAMYRLDNWQLSYGCRLETAWAISNGIPIFDTLDALKDYLERN